MTTSWLSGLRSPAGCARGYHALALTLLVLGALPGLAATGTVTSLADDGSAGTLRSVMPAASAWDTIVFSVTGTITLTQGYLELAQNLTISGPGASSLAISGNNASRVSYVDRTTTSVLSGITIENGSADMGSGIYSLGVLTLSNCVLSNNSSSRRRRRHLHWSGDVDSEQ